MFSITDGSIDKVINNGLSYYRFRITYCGKTYERRARKKPDLKPKIEALLDSLNAGQAVGSSATRVGEWAEKWIETVIKPTTKPATYDAYKTTVKNHIIPAFGFMRLDKLQPMDLQAYFQMLADGLKANTINTIRRHIIMMYDSAITFGLVGWNPAAKTKPIKADQVERRALTEEECKQLLEVVKTRDYLIHRDDGKYLLAEDAGAEYNRKTTELIIHIALKTGMRKGEIFGLQWDAVDFEKKEITVVTALSLSKHRAVLDTPKTARSKRKIQIDDGLVDMLRKHKALQEHYAAEFGDIYNNVNNLVCCTAVGTFISATNFSKRFLRPALDAAGIGRDVSFHSFRHTHCSQLIKAGVSINVVSQRLGHYSAAFTVARYSHLLPGMQERAVEVMNMIFDE